MAKQRKHEPETTRDQLAATLAASMPDDQPSLLAEAMAAVVALDAAVMAGDNHAAYAAENRYQAIIWKLNGGTFFGSHADEDRAGEIIDRHCCAMPGSSPMWGQNGQFIVRKSGIRALVEFKDGMGLGLYFAFHAVDLDRPFISETGYRSYVGDRTTDRRAGFTVGEVAALILDEIIRSDGVREITPASRDWLAGEPLPDWCAALQPSPVRTPTKPIVPPGFVWVDVVLPAHRAFIVRRWAEQARACIVRADGAKEERDNAAI